MTLPAMAAFVAAHSESLALLVWDTMTTAGLEFATDYAPVRPVRPAISQPGLSQRRAIRARDRIGLLAVGECLPLVEASAGTRQRRVANALRNVVDVAIVCSAMAAG